MCANQFLPCSSSGIALFGMKTVKADSCLDSEQIDTPFISVGGQEGGFGGWVVILGHRPKIWTCLSMILILDASCMKHKFWQENSSKKRVGSADQRGPVREVGPAEY